MTEISVIIPVYKLKIAFLKNLKHNYPFIKDLQIVIVNDDPATKLGQELALISKKIILISNAKNLGFAKSINKGVEKAKGQYLMLLNSDVLLRDTGYKKALSLFEKDKKLFAVSFGQIEKDGSLVGANQGVFKKGLFHHSKRTSQILCETLWPEGGACIIDQQKFKQLKGFDQDYSPFYWEDVDLGYRAWQTGYRVLFNPEILVTHHHETTISTYFTPQQIKIIAFRNQFLFVWKNIRGWQLVQHLLWLPWLYLTNVSNQSFRQGLNSAVKKFFFHEN